MGKELTLLHQPVALGTVNPTIRVFHRVVFGHGVLRQKREKENTDPVGSDDDEVLLNVLRCQLTY